MLQTNTYLYSYHKLVVYQKAKELTLAVYRLTKQFPKNEQYILLPQMRRAAISIVANIIEGYSKHSRKDFARFLDISIGSAAELGLYLELSQELGYLDNNNFTEANNLLNEVKRLLYSFQKSLKKGRAKE